MFQVKLSDAIAATYWGHDTDVMDAVSLLTYDYAVEDKALAVVSALRLEGACRSAVVQLLYDEYCQRKLTETDEREAFIATFEPCQQIVKDFVEDALLSKVVALDI